ncbi:protodermal factor 1 [Phtheirospermum japonicum]|uniref:Protodermal factor 1 n=1 Tax=Phtheirospermum japonicum TaxID=374723 RepID=A0A830B0L5_9LAMI|nr:protodermal factor 1 [Phtheirospermum japonicum]
METKKSVQASLLLWAAVAALFSQNLVTRVTSEQLISFEDQKNFFYYPDPNASTPPAVSYTPPAHGTPTTPTHGGGKGGNCGNTPSGGGHYHPTPTPHKGGTTVAPPTTPTVVPRTPTTPAITVPSPPFSFDPNSPPFTCTYWRNHPTLIWGLLGWWGSVGSAFGVSSSSSLPVGYGDHMNLLQALSNKRTDGLGELYRQGTAALLNSMAHTKFPYTTPQVRDSFVAALGSDKAAAAQAQLFKLANEGKLKPARA